MKRDLVNRLAVFFDEVDEFFKRLKQPTKESDTIENKPGMAPPKRKNGSRAVTKSKKPKIDPWADISRTVNQSGLPEEVKTMFEQLLPLTVGEYADRRHRYQELVVECIGQ